MQILIPSRLGGDLGECHLLYGLVWFQVCLQRRKLPGNQLLALNREFLCLENRRSKLLLRQVRDNASMLSFGLTSGFPLCSPLDMKTAMTFFPSLDAALIVPPQPNSMSSGCAPTAKITSDFKPKCFLLNSLKISLKLWVHL